MAHPLLRYLDAPDAKRKHADFAARAGISGAFLSQIINGLRQPSIAVSRRLSAATGGLVSKEEIAFYTPPKKKRSRAA